MFYGSLAFCFFGSADLNHFTSDSAASSRLLSSVRDAGGGVACRLDVLNQALPAFLGYLQIFFDHLLRLRPGDARLFLSQVVLSGRVASLQCQFAWLDVWSCLIPVVILAQFVATDL